jgi:hypothetical protein
MQNKAQNTWEGFAIRKSLEIKDRHMFPALASEAYVMRRWRLCSSADFFKTMVLAIVIAHFASILSS